MLFGRKPKVKYKNINEPPEKTPQVSKTSKEKFDQIKKRIEANDPFWHNESQSASYLIQLIVESMNYREAEMSLEYITSPQDNSIVLDIYRTVFIILFPDQSMRCKEVRRTIEVGSIPILLNPWNGDRVLNAMFLINDENVYDGVKHAINIVNTHVSPLNIVVCGGGNHSQFAARYKQKGVTLITHELDLSSLYDFVEYDGDGFRRYDSDEYIDLQKYNENLLFYAGLLFELGRYLR